MFILELQGSPRKEGNTATLLEWFLDEARQAGAQTLNLEVASKKIAPCLECGVCEETGFCSINDEMQDVYPLLRRADVVVMATPIYFYGATAQIKALIDRSQALWARRYTHKLTDPGQKSRLGLLLALGATRGKNLFEGVSLTAKYFFDAVGAGFEGSLTYRQIEELKDIEKHPTALTDTKEKARTITEPFLKRRKVLFLCTENACRSQMASAFARYYAGDRIEPESGGSAPADHVNPVMEEVMKEKKFDMAYLRPKSIEESLNRMKPDLIVSMGCGEKCPYIPGVEIREWDLPDPAGKPIDFMRQIRDDIEKNVMTLADEM